MLEEDTAGVEIIWLKLELYFLIIQGSLGENYA